MATLTLSQVVRVKSAPTSGRERAALVERAHAFGHFGETEVFNKL